MSEHHELPRADGELPDWAVTGEIPVEDDPSIVYDVAALEAAERAAREADSTSDALSAQAAAVSADESWVPAATAPGLDAGRSLEVAYQALLEAGIPAGFDPYRPGELTSVYPTPHRAFHVLVPSSKLADARRVLDEVGVEVSGPPTTRPGPVLNMQPPVAMGEPIVPRGGAPVFVWVLVLIALVLWAGSVAVPWIAAHL